VSFLSSIDESDLPAVYRAATIYVGLSREEGKEAEGFGLSLVEAQASGRAVVAARSGGIPESVADGVSGILVPPADPPAAADAIGALLDDDARRNALAQGGRGRVERALNWARVAEELRRAARDFREGSRR
jgi:glycosyltransferase involved in cell wall biosynthesis